MVEVTVMVDVTVELKAAAASPTPDDVPSNGEEPRLDEELELVFTETGVGEAASGVLVATALELVMVARVVGETSTGATGHAGSVSVSEGGADDVGAGAEDAGGAA